MDRLTTLRTFVLAAEHQSFAEAARRQRLSPTAVSRGISELEESLGVTLLRRTTRSVSLTPEGASYLERCQRILEDLDDADRSLRGELKEPHGLLLVAAPFLFGRMHILPVIESLLHRYPSLKVQLMLSDRIVRLVEEGIDVALRIADLADSALHAVRLTEVRRVLVASPAYVEAYGEPYEVAHLHDHKTILFEGSDVTPEWRFTPSGNLAVRPNPRFMTNSVEASIDAALAGLGITRVLSYQVQQHVENGRLRYLLSDFEPLPVPVHLVFQGNRRRTATVDAFISASRAYCKNRSFA